MWLCDGDGESERKEGEKKIADEGLEGQTVKKVTTETEKCPL